MLKDFKNFSANYYRESELLYLDDAVEACVFAEMENKKLKNVRNQNIEISLVDASVIAVKKMFFWSKSKKFISDALELQEEKIRNYIQLKITNQLRKRKNGAEFLRALTLEQVNKGIKYQQLAMEEQVKNMEYEGERKAGKKSRRRMPRDNGTMVMGGASLGGAGLLSWLSMQNSRNHSSGGYSSGGGSASSLSLAELNSLSATQSYAELKNTATSFANLETAAGREVYTSPKSEAKIEAHAKNSNDSNYAYPQGKEYTRLIADENNESNTDAFSTTGSGNASSGSNGSINTLVGTEIVPGVGHSSSATPVINNSGNVMPPINPIATGQIPLVPGTTNTPVSAINPIASTPLPANPIAGTVGTGTFPVAGTTLPPTGTMPLPGGSATPGQVAATTPPPVGVPAGSTAPVGTTPVITPAPVAPTAGQPGQQVAAVPAAPAQGPAGTTPNAAQPQGTAPSSPASTPPATQQQPGQQVASNTPAASQPVQTPVPANPAAPNAAQPAVTPATETAPAQNVAKVDTAPANPNLDKYIPKAENPGDILHKAGCVAYHPGTGKDGLDICTKPGESIGLEIPTAGGKPEMINIPKETLKAMETASVVPNAIPDANLGNVPLQPVSAPPTAAVMAV